MTQWRVMSVGVPFLVHKIFNFYFSPKTENQTELKLVKFSRPGIERNVYGNKFSVADIKVRTAHRGSLGPFIYRIQFRYQFASVFIPFWEAAPRRPTCNRSSFSARCHNCDFSDTADSHNWLMRRKSSPATHVTAKCVCSKQRALCIAWNLKLGRRRKNRWNWNCLR